MMVDGIRLPEQYFFGDYYILGRSNYINFDTLKAVEVFKGPASSLYGSDALGGLVYFRSLSPSDVLEPAENYSFTVPFSYDSANDGTKESIKFATKFSDNSSRAKKDVDIILNSHIFSNPISQECHEY